MCIRDSDTSFGNSRNQGLALTDAGVYCIPDNDKMDEEISFSWSAILYRDCPAPFHIREQIASLDRKSTRLNSSHSGESRMPSSA